MITLGMPHLDMAKIADSGQVFRFNKIKDDEYELIAHERILNIKKIAIEYDVDKGLKNNIYELDTSSEEYDRIWREYFDLDTDYSLFSKNIPSTDLFLRAALEYSEGIRILKQDKWEMLISFIISQRKSIPAIKSSIEKICEKFGKKLSDNKYAFPTACELSRASIKDLQECSLGYRAPYIYEISRKVAKNEVNLEAMATYDDEKLLKELMSIKGVGIKVANCISLFGYYRIDAFPIDVWISRMIDRYYNGEFPIELYKGYAGIIQQYIFFYGREMDKLKDK